MAPTGSRTDVHDPGNEADLQTSLSGSTPDFNTALVRIARTEEATPIEVYYGLTFDSGITLIADVEGPPVITATDLSLRFRDTLLLNPDDYPAATALIGRLGSQALAKLHGFWGWAALLFLVWLLPKLSGLIDKGRRGLLWLGRRGWARVSRRGRSSPASPLTGDDADVTPPEPMLQPKLPGQGAVVNLATEPDADHVRTTVAASGVRRPEIVDDKIRASEGLLGVAWRHLRRLDSG